MTPTYRIAVVGTSWGGLAALRELVGAFPADLGIPVVVVQHRHRQSDQMLTTLLQDRTAAIVCEIEDKAPIEAGRIFVAPADYHVLIEEDGFSLTIEEPIRYSRPSIDLTFSSAADSFGSAAIGAILTGANADGAEGLRRIAERGGLALVQEPVTAESPAMPAAALKAVPGARVLTVGAIGELIVELAQDRTSTTATRRSMPRQDLPEASP
jgi:two-component system, chemotaxis family, protein-glutamate methylesterase/glutaminase